jgi:hypothetical protein
MVSLLEDNGIPSVVERVLIRPASARIGPSAPGERKAIMDANPLKAKCDMAIDAESGMRRARRPAATMIS